MKEITIKEFCAKHGACSDGAEWAMSQGVETMAELWELDWPDNYWLTWAITRDGVCDDRTLRLSAVSRCRSVQHLMTDPRSVAAVDVAERYANGEATDEELATARADAWDAASDAARDAEWAASDAAWGAEAATWDDASDAAWAVSDASRAAAEAATWRDANKWIKENASPNWNA